MIRHILRDISDAFNQEDLATLILFVTARCNLKCYFCCYKDNLNKSQDLPFHAYEKMAASIPRLKSLLLSGGEPFLREDLFDIVSLFVRNCGVRFVSLPNNGYFTDRVIHQTNTFLKNEKDVFLTLLFSIDGFADTHNRVRGLKDSWDKAMSSVGEALRLRGEYPNLRVNISTVVCEDNIGELKSWTEHIKTVFPALDYHNLEIVRVGMPNIDAVPRIQEISRRYQEVYNEVSRYYLLEKRDSHVYPLFSPRLARWITRGFDLARMNIDTQLIQKKKDWPFHCLAGKTIAVVDGNGDFRACELRRVLGNLRDYDYDILRALATEIARREVIDIHKGKCYCTHGCFIGASQRHYPSTFLYRMAWQIVQQKWQSRESTAA